MADTASAGEKLALALDVLIDHVIAVHPEPKLVTLFKMSRERAQTAPAKTKSQLRQLEGAFKEVFATFSAVASLADVARLKADLEGKGRRRRGSITRSGGGHSQSIPGRQNEE